MINIKISEEKKKESDAMDANDAEISINMKSKSPLITEKDAIKS